MPAKAQEIWESTIPGTTYLNVRDPRNPDGWTRRKVGGRGSKRITLTIEEREFNQELVQFENQHLDPFTNGTLVRIAPKETVRGENELADDQLLALLQVENDDTFERALNDITSEVVVRRLLNMARKNTTMARFEIIENLVNDRYRIGKTSLVVREMQKDDSRYADADL